MSNSHTMIIMQPTNLCNLNCTYCYVPGRKKKGNMTPEHLEDILIKILTSEVVGDKLLFVWHVGEPLLAGKDFYLIADALIKKHNILNKHVQHNIQTNGMLIDDEWANLFKQLNISITLSVDGPDYLHDAYRLNWVGKPSHKHVMKGIRVLQKHNIPFGGICVVTAKSIDYPNEIFDFYLSEGFKGLGLNIEMQEGTNEQSSFISMMHEDKQKKKYKKYKHFLSVIYSRWKSLKNNELEIREFNQIEDSLRKKIKYGRIEPLNTLTHPFHNIVVGRDGDIFTYSPELASGIPNDPHHFSIGNLLNTPKLSNLLQSKRLTEMHNGIQKGIKKCAENCKYFEVCGGGYPSSKYYENGSFDSMETQQCIANKKAMTDVVIENMKVESKYN